MSGAFANQALRYFELGLAVTPTTGDDGKKPLLAGYQKRTLGPDEIARAARRFPDANLAIVCGRSKLAVVDVDDPSDVALNMALDRFGPTQLISKTGGRGGYQLFYKGDPKLRPINFRHSEDWSGELRVDGNIIIAPPSTHFKTRRQYEFIFGQIEDVSTLPVINVRTLGLLKLGISDAKVKPIPEAMRRRIEVGERNNWLFSQCLRHAPSCDDLDALIDVARTRAEEYFGEPMSDTEIVKTARSAWDYEQRGENWAGSHARYAITMAGLRKLEVLGSDPAVLAIHLRLEHGGRMKRGEAFALDGRAMEIAGSIHGWSRSRIYRAADILLSAGVLVVVHRGTGRGNPNQYLIRMEERLVV